MMTDRTRSHDEYRDDLAAYALGSLEPESRDALEAHLQECSDCRAILAEYDAAVDAYPVTVPAQEPPDGALDRLVQRARTSREPPPPTAAAPTPEPNLRFLWIGFAAMAALLLVMLGWNLWLQFGDRDDSRLNAGDIAIVVPMAGSDEVEGASAHLVMDRQWKECELIASGLPALTGDKDYQLWFVRSDGTRESGAVFHPDGSGRITVQVTIPDDIRSIERVGVTEEPAGGSPGPTGRNVLRGQFSLRS